MQQRVGGGRLAHDVWIQANLRVHCTKMVLWSWPALRLSTTSSCCNPQNTDYSMWHKVSSWLLDLDVFSYLGHSIGYLLCGLSHLDRFKLGRKAVFQSSSSTMGLDGDCFHDSLSSKFSPSISSTGGISSLSPLLSKELFAKLLE